MKTIEINADHIGFSSIHVLEFLVGRPLDDVSLGYIHALRPSAIRLCLDGMVQMSAMSWRVTIHLKDEKIYLITQEVEVALLNGIQNGYDLAMRLQ